MPGSPEKLRLPPPRIVSKQEKTHFHRDDAIYQTVNGEGLQSDLSKNSIYMWKIREYFSFRSPLPLEGFQHRRLRKYTSKNVSDKNFEMIAGEYEEKDHNWVVNKNSNKY